MGPEGQERLGHLASPGWLHSTCGVGGGAATGCLSLSRERGRFGGVGTNSLCISAQSPSITSCAVSGRIPFFGQVTPRCTGLNIKAIYCLEQWHRSRVDPAPGAARGGF